VPFSWSGVICDCVVGGVSFDDEWVIARSCGLRLRRSWRRSNPVLLPLLEQDWIASSSVGSETSRMTSRNDELQCQKN
jgi:hypothetical protein